MGGRRETLANADGIDNKHAAGRADEHRKDGLVLGGQRHGGQLCLIPHFGDEKGDGHRPKGAEIEPLVFSLQFIAPNRPEPEQNERPGGNYLDELNWDEVGKVITGQNG